MRTKIRLNERQLRNIIRESVNDIILEEGLMDKIKGAWSGMKNGFSNGQDKMDKENFRLNTTQSDSLFLQDM